MSSCGYCYVVDAKLLCGKCRKRSYCSKECQKDDWSCGHKHWCGVAGEVAHDFEIKDTGVIGKGVGVFALRFIKKNEMVLAERPVIVKNGVRYLTNDDTMAAFQKLEPNPGSLQDKFSLNSVNGRDSIDKVYLNFSRINHHCQGNVTFDFHEAIILVVATQDIEVGEELGYTYINQIQDDKSKLLTKWNIDCKCSACSSDANFGHFWGRLKVLSSSIVAKLQEGKTIDALKVLQEQMKLCETSRYFNVVERGMMYYMAMKLSMQIQNYDRSITLDYARKSLECQRVIFGNRKISDKCGDIPELLRLLSGTVTWRVV